MPHARVNACEASLPTAVELGRDCFKILRTQATGGSNSTAEGGALAEASAGAEELMVTSSLCCSFDETASGHDGGGGAAPWREIVLALHKSSNWSNPSTGSFFARMSE